MHDRTVRMPARMGPAVTTDAQPDYRQAPVHPPNCRDGWLGGRNTDQPRPCPTCKPWLTTRRTDGPPVPRKATR